MSDNLEGQNEALDEFDLTIQIGGLCMLVPDAENGRLHVLMPTSSGEHQHDPCIRYEDGMFKQDFPLGRTLDLTSLGSTAPDLRIPAGVLNLTDVVERRVSRTLLNTDPPGQVKCHVQLASGSATALSQGGKWKIRRTGGGEHSQLMATDLFWTIPLQGKSFPLGDFVTNGPDLFPRIDKVTFRPTVKIKLIDVPKQPYPDEDPQVGDEEHHFHLYYKLFDRPPADPPTPIYDDRRHPFSNPRCILSTASIGG